MPVYQVANPYRASTGSMPVPVVKTSNHRSHHNKYVEECSSCGSSYTDEHTIPLNTPFSTPPTAGAVSRSESRRVSHSSEMRPVIVSAGQPTPSTLPPPGAVLHRYQNGALVYEPASSMAPRTERHARRNSVSSSQPRTYHHHHDSNGHNRHHHRHGHASSGQWQTYQHEIDIRDEQHGVRGRTRIPRRLVNKQAMEQTNLQFEEEEGTGAIIVFRALPRQEIEMLVQATEAIRSHRREKHVRIIPEPTQTIIHHTNSRSADIRQSEERIIHAEERAEHARQRAMKKEYRADATGSFSDEVKARKARADAEEKRREAEEVIVRERRRREEKVYGTGATHVRVAKAGREVVIVR